MKIVHICLNGCYTDGWNYQENVLSKYHKKMGLDVTVIASHWIGSKSGMSYFNDSDYFDKNGVKIIRLDTYFGDVHSKFKKYKNLYHTIERENPDYLFVHSFQFRDIRTICKYLKKHQNVTVYVDNHADYSNSATNWGSKYILHGLIWKSLAHLILPYTSKFYGVLPARVEILTSLYKLPKDKCELLVMGADDEMVQKTGSIHERSLTRESFCIRDDDFLIVTGGKIDTKKRQVITLAEVVQTMPPSVKLLIFGSVSDDVKNDLFNVVDGEKIQYIGWADSLQSYQYFACADLVVFPGRHSVYWEQATAQGIPLVVKDIPGTHHVDLGGNVRFIKHDDGDDLKNILYDVFENKDVYHKMKKIAVERGMKEFSYSVIAGKSIDS